MDYTEVLDNGPVGRNLSQILLKVGGQSRQVYAFVFHFKTKDIHGRNATLPYSNNSPHPRAHRFILVRLQWIPASYYVESKVNFINVMNCEKLGY